jgi:triacylglycerol lipase
MTKTRIALAAVAAAAMAATAASAQVTPEMKAKIFEIGDVVDPPSTALLYRPLQPSAPYAGVKVTRDQAYGPDARNILDVFEPASGAGPRPVLIFVPGGAGNKIEPVPGGEAFYDNVMLWAVKNGMTGVNMQRRGGGEWDATAKDVSAAIQWVRKNIARHGGDPSRIFIWGHSAGAMSLANYLSHPNLYGPDGVGVKGAVLMAGPYNLAPYRPKADTIEIRMGMNGPRINPFAGGPAPDPAVLLQQSMAPGLKALDIPLFVSAAEIDPPMLVELAQELNRELTAAGKPPKFMIYKDHGHMSEIFAVNTADVSTSKPVLDWMRAIK